MGSETLRWALFEAGMAGVARHQPGEYYQAVPGRHGASGKQDLGRVVVAFSGGSSWRGPMRASGLVVVATALGVLVGALVRRREPNAAHGAGTASS